MAAVTVRAIPATTLASPRPLTVMITAAWPVMAFSTATRFRPSPSTTPATPATLVKAVGVPGERRHLVAAADPVRQDEPSIAAGRSEHCDLHLIFSTIHID